MLATLYKRTATGAIQVWDIEVEALTGRYRTHTSKLGGKITTSDWTVPKAKNAGRSNATTPQAQGMLEARAAWEKKQRDGYSLTADAAQGSEVFQCMLAQTYVDHNDPKKSRKPRVLAALAAGKRIYSQPKLDGIRLIASRGAMRSRKGRPIVAVPHVEAAVAHLFEEFPDLVLDGELYSHELKDDFDSLVSIVRTGKPTAEDLETAKSMEYWIYDCTGGALKDADYAMRIAFLNGLFGDHALPLCRVPTHLARSEEEIDKWYGEYLGQGYEGQMLRFDVPYENKRSDKLIKRKEYEDKEFLVVEIVEGEGNRSGEAGFVEVVEPGTEIEFAAGIKAAEPFRIELLNDAARYRGGEVTIRFNGRTPKGVPRFPRAIAWHPGGRSL